MAAFEDLPEELMALILAKLPVKSLMRIKCVRKSWYFLIKSPQFNHLHRSSSSSSPQFVIRRCVQHPRHVLSFYSKETLDFLDNEIDIPISNYSSWGDLYLSGSCDGLVCISNHSNKTNHHDEIIICNPALRELRSLFVPPSFGNRSGYHVDSVAFGTDPKTGEYKVVMIGVPYDFSYHYDSDTPDEECFNYTPEDDDCYDDREFKVYDFRTDSWRETAGVIPAPFCYSRNAISLNGAFHWCPKILGRYNSGRNRDDSNILRFNISDEVIDSIPLPDFVDVSVGNKKLCVSSKSQLSLIVCFWRDDDWEGRYEISVMTEYGVKESWTRLFRIGPHLDLHTPLAFWSERHLLLLTIDGQLVSCDLQHQNFRRFPIYYVASDVFSYSETLVSVNGIGE